MRMIPIRLQGSRGEKHAGAPGLAVFQTWVLASRLTVAQVSNTGETWGTQQLTSKSQEE